jgi:TatD-related deoxyribonuclease
MLPILDDHAHLQTIGTGFGAVRQFEQAGGTHLIISHASFAPRPIFTKDDWRKDYGFTTDICEEARRATGVKIYCVLGPYPGDLFDLQYNSDISVEKTFEIMKIGVEVAAELVKEQKAIGIGEIGRPHFPTDEKSMRMSNEIMLLCMEKAKDLDCPVVIHSEHVNGGNLEEFTSMAKGVGLKPERVVKHYTGKLEDSWPKGEISLSVLATEENVVSAIRQNLNFMMETDYLDDPSRPGAVLALPTVPKRMKQLSQKGIIDEKLWRKIHVEMPRRSYGIDTEGSD